MLSMDDFKLITFEDKEFFDDFYGKYPPEHSDYLFSTMLCWQHYMRYHYARVSDWLVIMTERKGELRFRPPRGPENREIVLEVMDLASDKGAEPPFSVVATDRKKWLEREFPDLVFLEHRDFFDYVYLAEDLAGLKGKRYLKIRNQLNYFVRNFPYTTEEISHDNFEEVKEFLGRWCMQKGCEEEPLLESERIAVQRSLDHFFRLGLGGIALRINGKVEAFSVFERMSPDTAIVHFEKANIDYRGIYQAINRETAEVLAGNYRFINREPDMGVPGLRAAKMKYHPHHMVKLYHVEKRFLG